MEVVVCNKRNVGIEILRIVAMGMVVLLHVLGSGGILKNTCFLSVNYEIAWFLEILAYCAVNCYALISGYVLVNSKFKYSNIVFLWLRVFFYTFLISVLFFIFIPETFTLQNVLKIFFPVSLNQYWYFTSYFCMFFFIPYMNLLLNKLNKKSAIKLILTIIVFFSLTFLWIREDIFSINNGYSILWLSCLYMIGGCIKKYKLFSNFSNKKLLLGIFSCTFFTWFNKFLMETLVYTTTGKIIQSRFLIEYNSITVLLQSIFLLVLFSRVKVSKRIRYIEYFSKLSFSIYIIHQQHFVVNYFIKDRFADCVSLSPYCFILVILGSVIIICLLAMLVDSFRDKLFKKFKVKEFSIKVVETINKFILKFIN